MSNERREERPRPPGLRLEPSLLSPGGPKPVGLWGLSWMGKGTPGPWDDRLGSILQVLEMPVVIVLKSPLLYVPWHK